MTYVTTKWRSEEKKNTQKGQTFCVAGEIDKGIHEMKRGIKKIGMHRTGEVR